MKIKSLERLGMNPKGYQTRNHTSLMIEDIERPEMLEENHHLQKEDPSHLAVNVMMTMMKAGLIVHLLHS